MNRHLARESRQRRAPPALFGRLAVVGERAMQRNAQSAVDVRIAYANIVYPSTKVAKSGAIRTGAQTVGIKVGGLS